MQQSCTGKEPIRELLSCYGLRASLIRFKVIHALLLAQRNGHTVGAHGVHHILQAHATELRFTSVLDVLRRRCDVGIIFYLEFDALQPHHPVPHLQLGNEVLRLRRVHFQLLAQMRHVHAQVVGAVHVIQAPHFQQ